MSWYLIFLTAFAYTALSSSITNIVSNQKRVREIQQTFKDIRDEFERAMKEKDDAKLQVLDKKQRDSMPMIMEQTIIMMKPLILIIPLLIVLLEEVRLVFSGFVIKLPISLPVFFQNLDRFPNWRDTFGPVGWFWICVLLGSLVLSGLKWLWSKYVDHEKVVAAQNGQPKPA